MFTFGMTDACVRSLPNDPQVLEDAWREIQAIFDLPTITEQEIRERGIPDGSMYVPFRGNLNGVPVCGRLVQTREGQDFVVSVRYDAASLRRQQGVVEQLLGRYHMLNGE